MASEKERRVEDCLTRLVRATEKIEMPLTEMPLIVEGENLGWKVSSAQL